MKKILSFLLFMILSASSFAGEPIKIGVFLPMTGQTAAFGQMTWSGIKIAHMMEPKVLGREVELILADEKSDKIEAANAAERLIEKDRVVALIGTVASSNTLSAAPIAERSHIPLVTPASTNPLVTQGKRYVFRACFVDTLQGKVAAMFAYRNLGARRAAILMDVANDYSVGLSSFFIREFKRLGGRIVTKLFFQQGDQDFTAQLTAIKGRGQDVIYVPAYYTEVALIARQKKDLGIKGVILSGDGAEADELLKIGGDAVEGLYFTAHFDARAASTERGRKYVALFKKLYPGKAVDSLGALGADAYFLILEAIRMEGKADPESIRKGLSKIKNFQGVTGIIRMEHGDAIKSVVIKRVENGKFVYVTTINP